MAQLEVADVFRQFGPSYLERFGASMLPSHRRAIEDIVACRTEAMASFSVTSSPIATRLRKKTALQMTWVCGFATLGGHVFQCDGCGKSFYSYHGCRNRSCPACHTG